MGFSQEWEQRFKENTHLSIWPWSDLVSLVMRNRSKNKKKKRVLELGFGAGANIPLFVSLGDEFFGVDGSETMTAMLSQQFLQDDVTLSVADFTKEIPFEGKFDLIYDRGSVTCNTTQDIQSVVSIIRQKLSDDGIYIGVDWFSTEHTEYQKDVTRVDDNTVTDYVDGPFANTGTVHYSDQQHLEALFSDFEFLHLEKKTKESMTDSATKFVTWDFIVKPNK